MSGTEQAVVTKPVEAPVKPEVLPDKVTEVSPLAEATFTAPVGNAREPGTVAANECQPKPAPVHHGISIGCGG